MPLAGYWSASFFTGPAVAVFDHWIAFGLLMLTGGKMIVEGVADDGCGTTPDKILPPGDFFRPPRLLAPAVATSIDAFAVGASLAFTRTPVMFPALSMGIVTGAVSFAGVLLGHRISVISGRNGWMTAAGGAVIAGIGCRILFQ